MNEHLSITRQKAMEFYNSLVSDVAGAMVESHVCMDAAMYQAENDAYLNYNMEVEEILKLAEKSREDWKHDVILRARQWSLKRC